MKTVFCTFLDSRDKNGVIQIKPLGLAKNKVSKPTLPGWKDVTTEIVIDKNYAKGLDGIEDYSQVKLLSRKENVLKVKGLDILDSTPIIDVKPYTSQYDKVEKAKVPKWVNKLVF